MKPPSIAAVLLLAGIFASVRNQAQSPPGPDADVTDSEYQVLSAYINDTFIGSKGDGRIGAHVARIVVANKTQSDLDDHQIEDENGKRIPWSKTSRYLRKQSPLLQASTLNSFRDANTHPAPLRPRFQLSLPYELVDKGEIDAIFENNGWWTDYYKKYPDSQGFLAVSRIGFSADGKQAMLYSANGCGGKCGAGTYVVMEKVGASWRVAKEILMWVS
jgi:hypothetical protein